MAILNFLFGSILATSDERAERIGHPLFLLREANRCGLVRVIPNGWKICSLT
jgi:hypothetical protein